MAGRIIQTEKTAPKLPIVGKIRVGEKRKHENGKEYPVSLDYFKASGDYANVFHETFGEKPTTFGIVFINDNPTVSCNERYELRDKKTGNLLGDGDGQNFRLWNHEKMEYEPFTVVDDRDKKKLAEYTKFWANGEQWRVILTAEFVIPKISSVMGLWKLETKGALTSIPNIRDTFDEIQRNAGTVVNIPFDFQIKKVTSQKPGDKKLYPVVSLIPNIGADKIDEVNQFLTQGNNLRDIKRFLSGNLGGEPRQLGEGEKG